MTKRFRVIERQTVLVAYDVDADNETQARARVQAVGCCAYSEILDWLETNIEKIEELEDDDPPHEEEPSDYGRFEDSPSYRSAMIDAGRGRLIR